MPDCTEYCNSLVRGARKVLVNYGLYCPQTKRWHDGVAPQLHIFFGLLYSTLPNPTLQVGV